MTNLPDETDLTAKIAAMERELAELPKRQTTVERSGSSTAFAGDQNTVIPGKVLGHVIQVYHLPAGKPRLSDKDVERILAEYLRWVRDAYDRARLFGMEGAPAARPGGVVPMEQLLDKVWGPECRGGPQVVYVHIRWLRERLEQDPKRPQHVIIVHGVGYQLV